MRTEVLIPVEEVQPGDIVCTHGKSEDKEVVRVRQSGEYMVLDLVTAMGRGSVASIKLGGSLVLIEGQR